MKIQKLLTPLRRALPIVLLAAGLLAACSPTTSQPAAQTENPQATQTVAQVVPTETSLPPTPTAQPGKTWLVSANGSAALETVLREQAEGAGWTFETRPALQAADLGPEVRVVVFDTPPANLGELITAAPQAQFVVLTPSADMAGAGNLSVIRMRQDYQAFVAGQIAALYADGWRAGALLPADGPLGSGLADAFTNGGRYFCGMCAPGWPLGVYYPLVGALPAASDGPSWQAAAAGLFDEQKVNLFFLSAEAAKPEVYSYLQSKDQFGVTVRLIGVQSPPPELASQWLVTVGLDAAGAMRQLWPAITTGQGGQTVEAPIVLTDMTDESPGIGRMRLVDELLQEIAAGRIYPLTLPSQ